MFKIAVFAVLLVCAIATPAIAAPAAPAPTDNASATVNSFSNQVNPDGSFGYEFETSNGIKTQASGTATGTIQGQSSYLSPEGETIELTYIADENGYQPKGSNIPAIPEAIQRSLDYIRAHPTKESA